MDCYTYILGSDGRGGRRTYVGWTTDLARRLAQHNTGVGARSTRGRTWILLYFERHANRGVAMSREWQLKRDRRFRKRAASGMGQPPPAKGRESDLMHIKEHRAQ